ncbi:recombinase family protein [Escherichia fergusonii]|nr:recombinase family protein [Escherichia fergusonii]EJB0947700.1 recombinase family protein [Escherichia fergusonii]
MKTKLYSYIRFSSMKQADGSSFERQKRTAKEIAAKYDLELVTSYQDFGVSAFKGANSKTGALSRFMDEIGRSVPVGSWLVVENLDRISRQSVIEAQELFLSIIRRGITIVTGMDGKVYSKESVNANPIDLLLSVMLFARANEESQTKRNRTNSSALLKVKTHQENPQNPAVAIEEVGRNIWWADTSSGYVLPHPVYFPVIKKIVELKQNGYSNGRILDYLNERIAPPNYTTNKDTPKKWARSMLGRMFTNRALLGIKEITIEGVTYELKDYYPRVMEDAEFYQLKKTIGLRSFSYPTKSSPVITLLSGAGLLRCGHCGASMVKRSGSSKERLAQYRYMCDGADSRRTNCDHPNWGFRGDQLDKAVLQLLADKIWIAEDKANPIPGMQAQIEDISRKIDNLISLSAMTGATKELADQITTLNHEREAIYNQIKVIEENMYSVDSQGWEKLAQFDLEDVCSEERLKVRLKIKEAVKSIKCYKIDSNYNHFVMEYIDGKIQRIVIERSRRNRKGQIFVDLKTINDRQILESNGLVLHPCLDMLTDKNWKPEEEIPGPLQEFGI